MFTATKREISELYTFFRLLADGSVAAGTPQATPNEAISVPVSFIQREEHDGTCRYYVESSDIRIVRGQKDATGNFQTNPQVAFCLVPRAHFASVADEILNLLKNSSDDVEVSDALELFLNQLNIYELEAQTNDRTDLHIAFYHPDVSLTGVSIRCRLSPMNPLLDGGRTANLKFEQTGVRFAVPTVNKVNATPAGPNEVRDRLFLIERLGGVLKYNDVCDRVFRCNLSMIDLHFPRFLAEVVRLMHIEDMTRTADLVKGIVQLNPLKIKDELITKHGFYEYKMKQFLLALALGMRPAKIYRGEGCAIHGMLLVDGQGRVMCYHRSNADTFADFLYLNTRFEKGSLDKDKYGFLERENGSWYFKLNAKIGLTKR